MSKPRVLVACEFSGIVRDAFAARGFDAWSCDIVPAKRNHSVQHIRGDVLQLFDKYGCANCNGDGCERCKPFDLMIAHPPCTHLCVSGAKHFPAKRRDGRQRKAIDFFLALAHAPIPHIAIENPVGIMSSEYRKPDQTIQPWQFGDEAQKTTHLWLVNLPPLQPTNIVGKGEFHRCPSGKTLPKWYSDGDARTRSTTFPGIANAMACQWGDFILASRKELAA